MMVATNQRADPAPRTPTRSFQAPQLPSTPAFVQNPQKNWYLDKRLFAKAKAYTPPQSLHSPQPRKASQETLRPSDRKVVVRSVSRHKPKHVPIIITQDSTEVALDRRPPSPVSPASDTFLSPFSNSSIQKERVTRPKPQKSHPVYTFADAPGVAYTFKAFPPTPSSSPKIVYPLSPAVLTPATSLDSTPRTSQAFPKISHSCEQFILEMSRPTTSGSRASTLDSDNSAFSPEQSYDERFKPASGSYLADTHSSSESSLNQAIQDTQNHVEASNGPRAPENAPIPTATSPQLTGQAPAVSGGTTNLSGLVCNVHKCTGKEPHGLVGATTTVLGDKLYTFGGRVLSRRRPYLTSDIFELDLIKRHWTKLQVRGDVPPPRYFHSICPLGDTKLICYGGMSPAPSQAHSGNAQQAADPNGEMAVMSDIHVFDAPTRTWTYISTAETPPGRYAHCAAVLPSTAIFSSANAPLSAILHNPPSSVPNQGSLGVALDGSGGAEMIVVGGQDSNNKYIDAVSVFNLRSLKWTDTQSLPRSCGAYRSVVTPLTGLSPLKIGVALDQDEHSDGGHAAIDKVEPTSSMLIYSNYNFLDVKLELQVRMPNGSLSEKTMKGVVSPPGLRFPNGDVLDNHFIVSGTYLTSSKHEYALWALDLRSLEWSRIDAGGGIFSQGSWNRGILWARRNTFVILGNRKRSLVDDYNHRRINFSNICMVELEAFGLYDNPRRLRPTSNYTSISAPILPLSTVTKNLHSGGRPLSNAAADLGTMAMNIRDLADMDLVAISGEKIPVNSYLLSRRWGPYFVKLLRESNTSSTTLQNDAASSSDGGTLRPGNLHVSTSLASRNSSITITPSITTSHSIAPSSITAVSSNSGSTLTGTGTTYDPPTPQTLSASLRPRQLYLPHTLLTLRALVHYLYTSSLPAPTHHLCTPQILCSLLQLARPYRIDGLLEATVERLHQILDGRNAAAVFNAAAMAAGGGRGTGTPFSKEGFDADAESADLSSGLTATRLQARNLATAGAAGAGRLPGQKEDVGGASESETDTASDVSSVNTSLSEISEESSGGGGGGGGGGGEAKKTDPAALNAGEGEIWSGGASCVVGLQKRGLRGLMEGRRIRENQRGRAVGGLGSPRMEGNGNATTGGSGRADVNGGGGGGAVGLGIA
ncbi:uncharacterized protein KY384_001891 [Bacidia gigantensis]|uniref:uncharacterized protein n=1 Tax=Bacidia gigantensis TaxID=2732470 RepID=UPI001D0365C5|nr:uncharacterized protein KY384_001891 [Bacidia gigantensis]KAG8533108.1 hypothetical protein KY384_001891 [Bacidia gigantensis]